jgi:hypothetical protein
MTIPSDAAMAEFIEYRLELARVCPEAADGLVFPGSQPPALSHRHRIEILRTLPDGAGIDAFLAAWLAFVAANPAAVPTPGATYEPDFYRSHGHGRVLGPPPAPITVDDYYRALRLAGESEEDARQVADDFADEVGRPGVLWVGDTLLYVALLSPQHEEKIREYLELDSVRMADELMRVRANLADAESRGSPKASRPPASNC